MISIGKIQLIFASLVLGSRFLDPLERASAAGKESF
jgi:hypothetical protein